jgi:hypothetical protein
VAKLLRMNRRGLKMKTARRVNRARQIVAAGLVDTGSEWDGRHIREVYKAIRPTVASEAAALDLVRAIWENRARAYKQGKIDYQAGIKAWEYEPEPAYFEEVVT